MNLDRSIEKLKSGDKGSFELIYSQTKGAVFSVCLSYMKNYALAEDMMQETFLKLFKSVASYRQGTNPSAWIYQIAKNTCLNELSKRKRETVFDFEENELPSDFELCARDESGLIALALKTLNENESYIVFMHVMNGRKLAEIAKSLGAKPATVRWQYRNAIAKLKKQLEKKEASRER